MKYNFNKMLLDFSEGKEFFTDYGYRDVIAYNDILDIRFVGANPKDDTTSLGYAVPDVHGRARSQSNSWRIDPNHTYELNSLGYRSPEFGPTDIVFAGCSHTFGFGVPEHMIWGAQVAGNLGLSYVNLSGPGQSVYFIVQNVLAHIRKYGPPKVVLALLPNLARMLAPNSLMLARTSRYSGLDRLAGVEILKEISTNNWHETENLDLDWRPKHQKIPFDLENILYPELAYYLNLQHLNILETVCEALGVPLIWSTWNRENTELFRSLRNERFDYFKGYTPLDSYELSPLGFRPSHRCDHEHLKKKYPHCFDLGSDVGWISEEPDQYRHAGAHLHTHWAESFLEALSKIKLNR
jgi:hypothetical protein